MQGCLDEDLAALRKLRDEDGSGALKKFLGDGEDPREWRGVTVADGRVTKLILYKCTKLATLPAAIGELGALITARTEQWRAENGTNETRSPAAKSDATLEGRSTANNDDSGPRAGSQAANETLFRELMETQKLLAKNNGGTCNNSCHCAIA